MAQEIKIIATDGSELVIEALGVMSQEDIDAERAALAKALIEAEEKKSDYEIALRNITDISNLSKQIADAKKEIIDALPKEATDQDIDDIFESDSVSDSDDDDESESWSDSWFESESVSESESESEIERENENVR